MTINKAGVLPVLLLFVASCSQTQLGLPRVAVQATSPDGQYAAFVRNHPSPDPPDQSLWLGRAGGSPTRLVRLSPDAQWSDEIVWSEDSRRVAFVINDAVVQVYEAEDGRRVFSGFVGRPSGDYPPRYILEQVKLSRDGRAISFIECERVYTPVPPERQNKRGTRREATILGCAETTATVALSEQDVVKAGR